MHDSQGINPLHPLIKELKKLTVKGKKKTDDDNIQIARIEWELGLYLDKDGKPMVPAVNVEACIRDAAKEEKQGRTVTAGLKVSPDDIPLIYPGPTTKNGLWEAGFSDFRSARIKGSRVNRCRPRFNSWELKFTIEYSEKDFDDEAIRRFLEIAGERKGLGDYRPRYGKFAVMSME